MLRARRRVDAHPATDGEFARLARQNRHLQLARARHGGEGLRAGAHPARGPSGGPRLGDAPAGDRPRGVARAGVRRARGQSGRRPDRPGARRGRGVMTALPSSLGRDTRQFRLLSNDAVRRLLNTALSSRDTDPVQFALWMVALVGTPPTFYAFNQTLAYASLRRAPAAVVERVAMGDRLFFVIYA